MTYLKNLHTCNLRNTTCFLKLRWWLSYLRWVVKMKNPQPYHKPLLKWEQGGKDTLRPRRNCRHFEEKIFSTELSWTKLHTILLKIYLQFVPKFRINNIPELVKIMACSRPGDKPLSEPMMVIFLDASLGLNQLIHTRILPHVYTLCIGFHFLSTPQTPDSVIKSVLVCTLHKYRRWNISSRVIYEWQCWLRV